MLVVALTGGIGSGKSTVASIFESLGVPIVDVDVISHQLTSADTPALQAIAQAFGEAFVNTDGTLNRIKMRQLVFSDAASRLKLEAILHPAIHLEALKQLAQNNQATYQILAIPLLVKDSPYFAYINRVLVIDCDEALQIRRTLQRSQLSEQEVRNIISAQISRESRLQLADDIAENNASYDDLRKKIELFHKKYINTCIDSK